MNRKPIIGVIGGGFCTTEISEIAEKVGEKIAEKGAILICGGLGGVMEAACKGAKNKNGITIGILPGNDINDANPYVDFPVATGMGFARNIIIVWTAQCLIAINGKYGTLSEIAYALAFNKPVVGLKTHKIEGNLIEARSPEDAVELAFKMIKI
ncbi:TIGR00725 family protein [candidate division KSB1 bacterium]|nr:MAG: TIGR00725 family protein [candidate division KSB1 bacterium]